MFIISNILQIFLGFIVYHKVSGSKKFPNHQIKANNKMQSLNSFTKPIITKTFIPIIVKVENEDDTVPLPRIEIYVRKYSVGLWIRLIKKSIYCGSSSILTQNAPGNLVNINGIIDINAVFQSLDDASGIEEETIRDYMDQWISSRLFTEGGLGLGGERNFIQQVKVLLPQFKKLKPKEFEFGYRYMSSDEPLEINDSSSSSSTDMVNNDYSIGNDVYSLVSKERLRINSKIANMSTTVQNIHEKNEIDSLRYDKILQLYNEIFNQKLFPSIDKLNSFVNHSDQRNFHSIIENMANNILTANSNHIDIFFDGSAYFSPQDTTSSSSSSLVTTSSILLNSNNNNSNSNNNNTTSNKKCIKASAGVYIIPRNDELYINNPKSAALHDSCLSIYSHSASSLIQTPFDAELFASLVAITLIHNILKEILKNNNNNNTNSNNINKRKSTISIYTDSKTMIKVFRSIHSSINSNKQTDIENTESSLLYNRGDKNRQLMWNLLRCHLQILQTNLIHQNERNDAYKEVEMTQWTPGHPERTKLKREWNFYDIGIWIADDIARGNQEWKLNFIQNNNNNNNGSDDSDDNHQTSNENENDNSSFQNERILDNDITQMKSLSKKSSSLHLDISAYDILYHSIRNTIV